MCYYPKRISSLADSGEKKSKPRMGVWILRILYRIYWWILVKKPKGDIGRSLTAMPTIGNILAH